MEHQPGFGALFESRGNGEETPFQGLYQDLLLCLGGVETRPNEPRRPMTGFNEILNIIMEVLNERENTATTGDLGSTRAGDPSKVSLKTSPELDPESASEAMDTSYIESAAESTESITTITLSRPGTTTADSDTDSESSFLVTTTDTEFYEQDRKHLTDDEEKSKEPGKETGDACCRYAEAKDLPPIPATPFAEVLPVPSKVAKLVAAFGLEGLVPVAGVPKVVRPCFDEKSSKPEIPEQEEEEEEGSFAIQVTSKELDQDFNGNIVEKEGVAEGALSAVFFGSGKKSSEAGSPKAERHPSSPHSSVEEVMEELTAPLFQALDDFNLKGETLARFQPRAVTVLPVTTTMDMPILDHVPAASVPNASSSERSVQATPEEADSAIDFNGNWMDKSPLSIGAALWTQMLDRLTGS